MPKRSRGSVSIRWGMCEPRKLSFGILSPKVAFCSGSYTALHDKFNA